MGLPRDFDPLADASDDSPAMRLLKQRGRLWRERAGQSYALAKRHELVHHVFGIPGAIATVPSLGLVLVDKIPTWAPFLLAALAACGSAWGSLGAPRKKDIHLGRFDCLERLVSYAGNRAITGNDPSQGDLDTLADEVKDCGDATRRSHRGSTAFDGGAS